MEKNLLRAKSFLIALSPDALRSKMIQNNLLHKKMFGYDTPILQPDGSWIVWFEADLDQLLGIVLNVPVEASI